MAVGVVALFCLMSPAITTLPMMPKALGGWRWKRTPPCYVPARAR